MRVQDRTSLGTQATETGRAAEAQKANRGNTGRSGATGSAEGDRVELSSTLGRLSQAIEAQGAQRSDRVQALASDYGAGRYQPNSEATSQAMVAEALSAAGQ